MAAITSKNAAVLPKMKLATLVRMKYHLGARPASLQSILFFLLGRVRDYLAGVDKKAMPCACGVGGILYICTIKTIKRIILCLILYFAVSLGLLK